MLKLDKEHVAQILEEMSTLLEFQGENPFKIRAYLNAAHALRNLEEDFQKVILEDRLKEFEGIGERLSEKIKILATSGTHPIYEELKKTVPEGLYQLLKIPGLGAKKIKKLYELLKITTLLELKKACLENKVSELKGFGPKTEQNILSGLHHLEDYSQKYLWWEAMQTAKPILKTLKEFKGVKDADVAGSLRRKVEIVGDLDFVASAKDPKPIMDWFTTQSAVRSIITHGPAKSSVRLTNGMQAELRIVSPQQYGFVLLYSTGSKNHNIKLRQLALQQKLSLSEWGFSPDPFAKTKKEINETAIYNHLGLDYIPPELREDLGEIEAAQLHQLPQLVEEKDIRGAFHVHTTASDGRAQLEEIIQGAQDLGWDYIGISDHSKSSFQANGLSEERLLEQVARIQKINRSKKYKIYIFAGTECDILPNGKLDYSDDILKQLDFVIGSVHSSLTQSEDKMTKRLIKALENPYTTILGHPSGRLLLRREGVQFNFQKVMDACIANGKYMELNGNPWRLDLDWRYWRKAFDKGLKCCLNPDAHAIDNLQFVYTGVNIARKGWLTKENILNTYPLSQVKKKLFKNH